MQTRLSNPTEQTHSRHESQTAQRREDSSVQMLDSRRSQTTQWKVQGAANASQSSAQLKLIQAKMLAKAETAQRVEEEEPLQGKFETAQRVEEEEPLQGKFETAQRVEEEEPLQGKFETAQRVEEEEPLQGKFETAQRVEEEEPLQGKFETAQRVEEEEPLQGKFETAQRVEEEEPLQGKFETAQRVEEEEPLQGKFETAQRVEEEEPLQGKFETAQRVEEEEPLQGKFETAQRVEQVKPNNTGLPSQLKAGIESLSGMSMDHVKVHFNSDKPAQLNAHAYAQGSDIHVAPGQEQHLPHEAWHVVQQAQGRVKPTMQMKMGVPVNDDVGLETEADVMGAKALAAGFGGMASGRISAQMKPIHTSISGALAVQLLPAVFDRAAFADPATYLSNRFGTQINEDAGSGGIQDEPVRKLVLELARAPRREVFVPRLIEAGGAGPALAESLTHQVYDRTTAHNWVIQNTLAISNVVPWALTIENVAMEDAPQGPAHTFHRDHGKVALTDEALTNQNVNSAPERLARRNVLNGPGGNGWVRGHNGVLNKKHRFINHVHVDKDAPGDAPFEIYDADSPAVGQTAENFNLANRAGFNDANDGRVAMAAAAVEGDAKRLSWETYEATLPAEVEE